MPTITKRQLSITVTEKLAEKIPDKTVFSQQLVVTILQEFIDTVAEALARGDSVVMRRFGTFEVREAKAKLGRDPMSPKVTYKIPARATVKFKPGRELKEKVAASREVVREAKKSVKRKPAS